MKNIIQEFNLNEDFANGCVDNLTGLYSHSIFQITVDHEINRSERYGKNFTIALIDIDHFSIYNEKNSYFEGDNILNKVATIIENNTRKVDIAARYSQDQFVIVITEADIDLSLKVIERIRESILQFSHFNFNLTVSIGMVAYPDDAKTRTELICKMHEALEAAKARGRNTVYYFKKRDFLNFEENSVLTKPIIMIVDDVPLNLKMLETMLDSENYNIVKAEDGYHALHHVAKQKIDLILLDAMMPGMDGFEVCQRLKSNEKTRSIPIIMVTALDDSESKIKGIEAGADDFLTKPPNKPELLARVKSLTNLNHLNKYLADIKNVLLSLAVAVEAKDSYTLGHVERVANLAVLLGKKLRMSQEDIEALWFAGVLHDIGKIGIPDGILNKNGKLNNAEWELMKTHAEIGYKICLPLKNTLGSALKAIRYHHEKLDGSGYPEGLRAKLIPEIARIMSIADYYDALTTDRPYRSKLSKEKSLEILKEEARSGKLDARIVDLLIEIVSE
ncbi:MAG: HD domain-containing phosphohydrolase [Candidatus Competibacter sp.]